MMLVILTGLFGALSALLLVPALVLLIEVVAAGDGRGTEEPAETVARRRDRVAVLVPAHDEAAQIADTVRAIRSQLHPSDRLLVVADNCTDATVAVAAAEGAEVIERRDAARRGKGHALAFGLQHLERDAPDVVIVIDADCGLEEGAIDRLAEACRRSRRPVQALYLMQPGADARPLRRLAQFAWTVRNRVRALGLRRLGWPCQLMGSGMAFAWGSIRPQMLSGGHIVEDLKLGIDLALAGAPPIFCPGAVVTSRMPSTRAGARRQRARWEHGHLALLLAEVPRLLAAGLRRVDAGLVAMALDLAVPPLSLLVLLTMTLWAADGLLWRVGGSARLPFELATAAGLMLIVSVVIAWRRFGRRILSPSMLALAVIYALAKVPLYGRFLWARERHWVRTERDEVAH